VSDAPNKSSRAAAAIGWLAPVALAWATLMVLSHRPAAGAVIWTDRLFGWTIAITYLGVMGWLIAINRTSRLAMFRWLALNLALGIAWLGLELAAALNLVNWRLVFDRVTGNELVNRQYASDFLIDRELEFRRSPGAHWAGPAAGDLEREWSVPPANPRSLSFQYDQWGYRNPTNLSHADVALIGDSFVDGWGVRDEETAARILEAELQLPVANLGVPGYGTMPELLVLKKESPRLKPSVIVWFFFEGNDLYDDWRWEKCVRMYYARHPDKHVGGEPVNPAQPWRQRSFAGNCIRLLRRWSDAAIPNRAPYVGFLSAFTHDRQPIYFASYASVPWSEWLADRWGQTRTRLEEGNRFCRERGIHLLLCYVPIKFRVYRQFVEFPSDSPCRNWEVWPLPKDFADFCRSAEIPFLDVTEPLQAAVKAGGMPYPRADSHWGPEGHRLVANILRDEIRRRGWFPAKQ
jgi:hypothetical protein